MKEKLRNERAQSRKWRRGWLNHCNYFLKLNSKENSDWHTGIIIPPNWSKSRLRFKEKAPIASPMVQKHEVGSLIARPESFEPVLSG